jgi:GntR family transcriptional regulator
VSVARESWTRPRRAEAAVRIADLLRDRILGGYYRNRRFPSEPALILEFACSRNAVRDALSMLREEGMVERTQGAGTFAVSRKLVHQFDRVHSSHDAAERSGIVPLRGRFIGSQTVVASPALIDKLALAAGAICTRLEFLTLHGDRPVAVTRSYVPGDSHGAPIGSVFSGDYYDRLEQSGIEVGSAVQKVEAVLADAWTADHLAIEVGAPLMLFSRVLYGTDGQPVETGFVRFSGAEICLEVSLPRL